MRLALLLDLGGTLVDNDRKVIAHVPEALRALSALRAPTGVPLALALVSNYTMAGPDSPVGETQRLFDEYVAIVRGLGLLDFFAPPEHHVTTSTIAGVVKPDPAIFRLALQRLGLAPDLSTAMFVTEEADHIAAARALGMTAWQYGVDFHDWNQAPALVAQAFAQDVAALRQRGGLPAEDRFQKMLEDNAAIAGPSQPLAAGQTHATEVGPDGKARPIRKRFSLK